MTCHHFQRADIIYFRSVAYEEIRLEEITVKALSSPAAAPSHDAPGAYADSSSGSQGKRRTLLAPGHRDILFETMDYASSVKRMVFPRDYVEINVSVNIPSIAACLYFSPFDSGDSSSRHQHDAVDPSKLYYSLDAWLAAQHQSDVSAPLSRALALRTTIDAFDTEVRMRTDSFAVVSTIRSLLVSDHLGGDMSEGGAPLLEARPFLQWKQSASSEFEPPRVSWETKLSSEPWLAFKLDVCPPSDASVSSLLECKVRFCSLKRRDCLV